MIINSAPKNEAVISNVGEIGEFRIQQSAEAFGILSSGLYANKIRAVIRELSCNAVDSHVSAGKKDTPFDVHLPNQLEPWFAIRDYGVGLDHDQVSKIYTTYFMSTKGQSNDQIGGLGLGSKSPFSYTDNFTVTTCKDGVKGIYTAFINEVGVPSIALMETTETTDPNGVEVKFSVNDRYDFGKFEAEARYVYTTFELRPVVSGVARFEFAETKYQEKNVIPGVHYTGGERSRAVMGNVPYPIEVPNSQANLGDLARLLSCGLELHFPIGDIKFQASREGLSYVPETIAAIKAKLEALNAVLATKVAAEANAFGNFWERQVYLKKKHEQNLFNAAVIKYMTDSKFPLVDMTNMGMGGRYFRERQFEFDVTELEKKYNIKINAFQKTHYYNTCSNLDSYTEYDRSNPVIPGQQTPSREVWKITASPDTVFVENDTPVGATERAKYHWKNVPMVRHSSQNVYVLSRADKNKAMKLAEFLKVMHSPPAAQVLKASALKQKPRAGGAATGPVTLLKLQQRGGSNRFRYTDLVWRDAGDLKNLDAKATHYYMPVSGFVTRSKFGLTGSEAEHSIDINDLMDCLQRANVPGTTNLTVYGVRKADIDAVKAMKNWVNLEDHIVAQLGKLNDKFWMGVLYTELDSYAFLRYNRCIKAHIAAKDSLFIKTYTKFDEVQCLSCQVHYLNQLLTTYLPTVVNPLETMKRKFVSECAAVHNKYPLLKHLSSSTSCFDEIAEYINLIDQKESI
jgi:hypothetical protein